MGTNAEFPREPRARRVPTADLPVLVVRDGVRLVGIDVAPATLATDTKTIGVVELPAPPSVTPALAEVIADHVVAKLRAAGAIMTIVPAVAEPERILISSDEAAALLGITRRALAKRVERHQVPGVCRVGRRIQFNKAKLLAGLDRRTRA